MPKNFDELLTKDRVFEIRGEKFEFIDVKPEVLSGFSFSANGGENENEVWDLIDAQILLFLAKEDGKRWTELRKREAEPVTINQMNSLLSWLVEEQTGRPTQTPSPSASGRGKTAASSKAE